MCQNTVTSDTAGRYSGFCCAPDLEYVTLVRCAGCQSGSYRQLGWQFVMA